MEATIFEDSFGASDYNFSCYLTVGLICTVARSKLEKTPTKTASGKKKSEKAASIKEEVEQVIVGCKVGVKDNAFVQVYVNLEKHLLLCIANGKIHEKFDLSTYSACIPVIKYDGDAHLHNAKVVASAQFDLSVPFTIEQMA